MGSGGDSPNATQVAPDETSRIGRHRLTQVFKFLEALNQHRNPAKRQIDEHPWVLRFSDLPDHPAIERHTMAADDAVGGYLLRVGRPTITSPPTPPLEVRAWLVGGWDDPKGVVKHHETRNELDARGNTVIARFDDDSPRRIAFDAWRRTWEEWANNERPARTAMGIFERFYELHGRIQREAERLELILGDGLLCWSREDGAVYHPVLLLRVQLEFDPKRPEFRIVETDRAPELYSSLFHSMPDVAPRLVSQVKNELDAGGFHPLGGDDTSGFLKSLAVHLSPRGQFDNGGRTPTTAPATELQIRRDPMLLLRPRTAGFATAVEAVLQDLNDRPSFPESLLRIVGVEAEQPGGFLDHDVTPSREISQPTPEALLSKPANREQIRIAQRLDRHGSVLVQGPPGTGKTHTIANLVGHLLAQGKSVLVTAHTTKALRVLRDQVVEQLRPLCVSVLESDTESRRQLESAVTAIEHRLSNANVDNLESEANSLSAMRDRLCAEIDATQRALIDARGGEYRSIVVGGQTFQPSDAARHVAANGEQGWIPGEIYAGAPLPLSEDEVRQLYATNIQLSLEEEREILSGLPDTGLLPDPDVFERLVRERAELASADRVWAGDYWIASQSSSLAQIEAAAEQLMVAVQPLMTAESWRLAATEAGIGTSHERDVWDTICNMIESVRSAAGRLAEPLLRHDPRLADGTAIDQQLAILNEIVAYLGEEGRLGQFVLLRRRSWSRLISQVRVAGKAPISREHFEALVARAELEHSRTELCQRWDRQMTPLGAPPAAELGPEPERTCAQYVPLIQECLNWWREVWRPAERVLTEIGFNWPLFLSRQAPVSGQHGALVRLRSAVQGHLQAALLARVNALRWDAIANIIAEAEECLQRERTVGNDGSVAAVRNAIKQLDALSYRASYDRLVQLTDKLGLIERRNTLLARLSSAAPAWADAIRARRDAFGKGEPPSSAHDAWLWKQLQDELDRRGAVSLQELQDRRDRLESDLQRVTSELIDRRAWAAQVRRTGLTHKQALVGWLGVVRRLGKGTGKRAPELRREATRLMNECKSAVPVWIMPLNRVVENFDPRTTRFDVVVIDEASQSDVMALIALYLGEKAVVVGDHEQVSPSAVGQVLDVVQSLITVHLTSVPNAVLYGGQLSVYDLAQQSFGGTIVLTEHFRCVPDIIQFSNVLSYNGSIQPLREAGSSTLKPSTIAHRVEGTGIDKVNPAEAMEVASLIAAACEEPEYAEKTFGVISLVGEEQAIEIERLVRNRLAPEECERRRLLCGNAAQFQGDERDVVFLSMVDSSPDGGPLAMRDVQMFRQRFNVAASRARDQLWVVHSLDPQQHLKAGDLRRRLIEHAIDPTALRDSLSRREANTESEFERAVMRRLMSEGYDVHPQWKVGHFRIDLVVQGDSERLAVECDGDRFHPPEKLAEDLDRQAILERLGWKFVRIRGSQFFRAPDAAMRPVFERIRAMGIEPRDAAVSADAPGAVGSDDVARRVIRRGFEIRAGWEQMASEPTPSAGPPRGAIRRGRQTPLLVPLLGREVPYRPARQEERDPEAQSTSTSKATTGAFGNVGDKLDSASATHPPRQMAVESESSPLENPAGQRRAQKRHDGRTLLKGGVVCRELVVVEGRFAHPCCSECGGGADTAICDAGIVVACASADCGHIEGVDQVVLRRLVDRLSPACFACGGPLVSRNGVFGNYLRCNGCSTNSSWRGVSDRLKS